MRLACLALASLVLAGCVTPAPTQTASVADFARGGDDAVVIAVVDSGFNAYHFDWRAAMLPQHLDADPANDLPLDLAPHEWLSGFPATNAFASYGALELDLPTDPDADSASAISRDSGAWSALPTSDATSVHLRYVPGTKIVGLVDFNGDGGIAEDAGHGSRSAAVAAGNLYGACPECLVVFVELGDDEAASEWVASQPWIDIVTNSWAFSELFRTFLYSGTDVGLTRDASERGQTIFWSSSNGVEGGGMMPITTLGSSQMGPDWIVTVAGISPSGGVWSGSGKPADMAAPGEDYPSEGAGNVSSAGTHGGTSAATPISAGMYGRALWSARVALDGPSRSQHDGVVARGAPFTCGPDRPACELADGVLTARELRTRYFEGALHTPAGMKVGPTPPLPPSAEQEFLAEGHGSFRARWEDDAEWHDELSRVVRPLLGLAPAPERPAGEREWFVVDSYCRQEIWGTWSDGDHRPGETTLPTPDPVAWPARTAYASTCSSFEPPLVARLARGGTG